MKHTKFCLISLLQASSLLKCSAFNPIARPFHRLRLPVTHHRHTNQVSLSGKNADEIDPENKSTRTDVNQFLTQRTIQTFMLLLKQIRDPHTGRWIEEFVESKNLLSYHGTGAICSDAFPNWDSMFTEMLERPPDVVVVEIKTNNAGRGLSKNNPYREKEVSLL